MTRYLISFDDGARATPEQDRLDAASATQAVALAARNAGVWVFGGDPQPEVSVVATDGTVTDGPSSERKASIGAFAIVDVPSRDEALEWAARIAVARRCAQEVRELVPDPTG